MTNAISGTNADAIVTFDHRGVINSFNLGAEVLIGYSAGEVIGETFGVLSRGDATNGPIDSFAGFRDAESLSGESIRQRSRGQRKDGTAFATEYSCNKIRVDGGALYIGIFCDGTDRIKTQRDRDRLLLAIDKSGDGIILFDADDRFVYAN
jgi:PAS domain S-box-containing protein